MRARFMEYDPLEIYGSALEVDKVNFSTSGVVTVLRNADLVSTNPVDIYLQSGKCPGHYVASQSASGLGTVRLTAPAGYRIIYSTQEGQRAVDTLLKTCKSWTWGDESGPVTLEPGESVELRPQKSGESTQKVLVIKGIPNVIPSGVKRMHGMKVFLKDVTSTTGVPEPPIDGEVPTVFGPTPVTPSSSLLLGVALIAGISIVGVSAYVLTRKKKEVKT